MDINKLEEKITKKEKEIKSLKEKLEIEKNKVDFIVIEGWAYETKEHNFNEELGSIKIPKDKELWLPSECSKLYKDKKLREKLNLKKCHFFVKQVIDNTTDVARFFAGSDYADSNCNMRSSDSYSYLGVRWKWRVKE